MIKVEQNALVSPVETREELLYLLTRASELEHDLACSYLYAGYSIKTSVDEGGLTPEELATIGVWKRKIATVAVEEMLHLGQVSNILTAVGGAPHFIRSNFPLPASTFPFGIEITLEALSRALIERFVCYEMPEEGVLPGERMAEYDEIRKERAAASTAQSLHACKTPSSRGTSTSAPSASSITRSNPRSRASPSNVFLSATRPRKPIPRTSISPRTSSGSPTPRRRAKPSK
ncbi:MAG: ferritin-like domain-containing protein [Candidatus Cybelea sp.]